MKKLSKTKIDKLIAENEKTIAKILQQIVPVHVQQLKQQLNVILSYSYSSSAGQLPAWLLDATPQMQQLYELFCKELPDNNTSKPVKPYKSSAIN